MLEEGADFGRNPQGFARRDYVAQGRRIHAGRLSRQGKLLERGIGQEPALHACFRRQTQELDGIAADFLRNEHQGSTRQPGREDLLNRDIKTEGCVLEGATAGRGRGNGVLPMDEIEHGAPRHRHALGLSRRARGVNHVAQVVRTCPTGHRHDRLIAHQLKGGIHDQDFGSSGRHRVAQLGLGQQEGHPCVVHHAGQTFLRIRGIERHVAAPGLDDTQQRHHGFGRAAHEQANAYIRSNAPLLQHGRHLIAALIQLAVSQDAVLENDGCLVRIGVGNARDQITQIASDRIRGGLCG